jgi:regulator of sigma E protease
MSYVLALLGFIALIILHEFGHFAVAKAVGMRVERFSLFMGPLLVKVRRGETEYGIGPLPLGGYVKITGMNPHEDIPPEVVPRAYYNQPVWKRIVVILAGPMVNVVIGFVLLVIYAGVIGLHKGSEVGDVAKNVPAQGVLHPGDVLVAVDGHGGSVEQMAKQISSHRCEVQPPTTGCKATTPARLVIERGGERKTIVLTPVWDPTTDPPKMRLGFTFNPRGGPHVTVPFGNALDRGGSAFWNITKQTVSIPAKIIDPEQRKQINGIVGSYETTRQTILNDPSDVVYILAVISLALGLVNLFPFLPLDGGHIFWAVVEKVRRKPVSFSVMERSGLVGFVLVAMLFVIGLTNDISVLQGKGFGPP